MVTSARHWVRTVPVISCTSSSHMTVKVSRGDSHRITLLALSPEQRLLSAHRPPAAALAVSPRAESPYETRDPATEARSVSLPPGRYAPPVHRFALASSPG